MAKAIGVGLGQGVNEDGTPSELSQGVVMTALKLLRRNKIERMLFTGSSSFRINYSFSTSEAESMKMALVNNNVNPDFVFIETKAKDTVGNWLYTKLILEKLPYRTVYGIRPPHQGIRADYVAPMVLGSEYNYIGIDSKECLVGNDLKLTIQGDKIGLEITQILWREAGIVPGDHKKIQEVLESTHVGYAKENVVPLSTYIKNSETVRKVNTLFKELNEIRRQTTKYSMPTKNVVKN